MFMDTDHSRTPSLPGAQMNTDISNLVLNAQRVLAVFARPFATETGASAYRTKHARELADRVLRHARQAQEFGLQVYAEQRWLWADDANELAAAGQDIAGRDRAAATAFRDAAAAVRSWGHHAAQAVQGCDESRRRAAKSADAIVAALRTGGRHVALKQ